MRNKKGLLIMWTLLSILSMFNNLLKYKDFFWEWFEDILIIKCINVNLDLWINMVWTLNLIESKMPYKNYDWQNILGVLAPRLHGWTVEVSATFWNTMFKAHFIEWISMYNFNFFKEESFLIQQ